MNIIIEKNVELAPLTTFKIGGRAKFFVEVVSKEEIVAAVHYARENKLKIFILGGGSNVLISDNGFDGLVIRIKNSEMEIVNKVEIICAAGVKLMDLVNFSVKNKLAGLEWAAGIPGTVGGAVRGNAGAFGGEIKDSVLSVGVIDLNKEELTIETLTGEQCQFNYRSSLIKESDSLVIVVVRFKLAKTDVSNEAEIAAIIEKRKHNQPVGPSAGSFFKNPKVTDAKTIEKFEHDMEMKMRGEKLPAGWFIDDLGFKGKKIGGAQVSEKHGNFIMNSGKASAEDVIILSSFLKQKVRDSYGVQLEEEVSRIGF